MPEEKKKLGEILLEAGVIDKFQLKSALAEQNKWGGRLGNHLVQMGILTEDLLVKALSKQLKIPNLDLAQMMVTGDVLELVPHEIAEKFHLVPVAVKKIANKRTLIVAMSDPTNLDAIDELQFRTGHIIKPAVAGDTAIELAIRRYYYGEMGPQRVAGQPIEFDAARPAQTAPAVTNVPSSDVPVPPENTFSLGEDEPPPAAAAPEIAEASLADLAVEPEPTQVDPPPTTDAPAWLPPDAGAPAADPVWPAPEPTLAEPEPYYDPNTAAPVGAEPAYDAAAEAPAWSEDPAATAPATYAEAPMEALEPEPLAATEPPTYEEPAPAEPYQDPAPAWSEADATAAPAWSAAEAPYPPDEPTVPADENAAAAETWAEQPAAVPPEAVEEAAASEPPAETWPDPAAAPEANPEVPELSLSLSEPSVEPSVLEPTGAPEISLDGTLAAPEPGPVEAAVAEMDAVPSSFSPGDAVQTFLGQHDGPYEPTTPGEPTNAPDETQPDAVAVAVDGGEQMVAAENGAAWEETQAADAGEPAPYADPGVNGNGGAEGEPGYAVPPDPLGGIPFDTAEGRAIRALCALLLEKGYLTADELASRLRAAVEGMGGEGHG